MIKNVGTVLFFLKIFRKKNGTVPVILLIGLFLFTGNIYAQGPDEEMFNKGKSYFEKQKYDEAITAFNVAIYINPKYADAYFQRGVAYAHKYNFDEALSDYARAIEIDPNLGYVYANRALVYFLKQEYAKSWEDARKAESLGEKVDAGFLEELKKVSGREN